MTSIDKQSTDKNKKWKDELLKSGLPLEAIVAQQLAARGYMISGQYNFVKLDENGREKEFSVDLQATKYFDRDDGQHAELHLLLEMKYATPKMRWIFSPTPAGYCSMQSCVNPLEQVTPRRMIEIRNKSSDPRALFALDDELIHCMRGIELGTDSGEKSINIDRGLHQLRYAIPKLMLDSAIHQFYWHPDDSWPNYVTALLITTAELFVLDDAKSIADYMAADELETIASKEMALMWFDGASPLMNEYARRELRRFVGQHPDLWAQVRRIEELAKGSQLPHVTSSDFDQTILRATQRIVVVNFDALTEVISKLEAIVDAAMRLTKTSFHVEGSPQGLVFKNIIDTPTERTGSPSKKRRRKGT